MLQWFTTIVILHPPTFIFHPWYCAIVRSYVLVLPVLQTSIPSTLPLLQPPQQCFSLWSMDFSNLIGRKTDVNVLEESPSSTTWCVKCRRTVCCWCNITCPHCIDHCCEYCVTIHDRKVQTLIAKQWHAVIFSKCVLYVKKRKVSVLDVSVRPLSTKRAVTTIYKQYEHIFLPAVTLFLPFCDSNIKDSNLKQKKLMNWKGLTFTKAT